MKKKLFVLAVLVMCFALMANVAFAETAETGEAKNAAAMEEYAPTVKTLDNGVQVQKVPSDPYLWNTAILNAENRGCAACHDPLEDVVQNLPLTHPELWNPYNVDVTIDFCYMCHSKALFVQDSMHTLHMNNAAFNAMGGNCLSCHQISTSTGEFQSWDKVKYDVMMGITGISDVEGEFSYTQDSITPLDQVFFYWENGNHRGMTPDNDLSPEVLQNWEITVKGLVDNEYSFTMGEMIDAGLAETRVLKMHCQTNPPAGSYIANCEVTGIPLSKILEKAGVQAEANTLKVISDDGWCYPLDLTYTDEQDPLLVYLINGETLPNLQGYPVQLWTPTLGGVHYTKRPATVELSFQETPPAYYIGFTNPKTGDFFNKPNVAIFNYTEGQIFPAGEEIVFEGFVDAYNVPMQAVELSMDKGKTWTTFELDNPSTDKWVNWTFKWTPAATGSYTLYARGVAADGTASITPAKLLFNVK